MKTPKGKLIPIGGNEAKKPEEKLSEDQEQKVDFFQTGILKQILSEIPKDQPVIEVLPIASDSFEDMEKKYVKAFDRLKQKVNFIYFKNKKEADEKEYLDRISNADAVFFTGGDQDSLVKRIGDSRLLRILKEKYYEEDFVIAGTSAGAMAMTAFMINPGQSDEALLKGIIEIRSGLSFITDLIIDSHFLSRGRMARLIEAVLQKKNCTGIGICEDTGVVIYRADILKAIGSGTITVIDASSVTNTNYDQARKYDPVFIENLKVHFLADGAYFSLKKKQFIPAPSFLSTTSTETYENNR